MIRPLSTPRRTQGSGVANLWYRTHGIEGFDFSRNERKETRSDRNVGFTLNLCFSSLRSLRFRCGRGEKQFSFNI